MELHNVNHIGTNLTCFIYQQPSFPGVSPMTFNDAFMILARCPSLQMFEFAAINDIPFKSVIPDSPDWDNETHRLWLDCLTRLSLSSRRNLEFGPLLDMLAAPGLKDLSLTGPFYAVWMEEDFDIEFNQQGDWDHLNNL